MINVTRVRNIYIQQYLNDLLDMAINPVLE